MEKQEVLEKIIYYITKQRSDAFYEIIKGKYYINISEIDNVLNRTKRLSFSNEEQDLEESLSRTINNYKNKQITFQELKIELSRIMYDESNKRDKLVSELKSIPEKRKLIEDNIKQTIQLVERKLEEIKFTISEVNIELYLSNYIIFVHKFHQGKSSLFEINSNLASMESYTEFMCRESVMENIVKEHYDFMKQHTLKIFEKKSKPEYYTELKNIFLGMTKEELYLPIEKIWNIKLGLDVLYYIPTVKESKLTSFYFITDKCRVNKKMKIDPYLYWTTNTFQQIYMEEAVEEFKCFYNDVFGSNDYKKDFLSVLKTKGAWKTMRNLFINLCIVSNTYVLGELLRSWTSSKKFYEEATYEKNYPSYITNDIISQKIRFGIETSEQVEKFIVQCNVFDRKDDLDSDFVEKNQEVIYMIFNNYNIPKINTNEDDN